jgi:hypothetical protein
MRENRLRALACCRARSGIESGASRAAAVDPYYEPKTPVVICDTRDQIMQVLDAVWAHKVKKKFDEFVKAAGPNDEPGCLYSDIGPTLFGASEHVGVLFDNERAINLRVSHVGNRRGESLVRRGWQGNFRLSAPMRPLGPPRRRWDPNICAFGNQASF